MQNFDIVVLGAGPGGYVAAIKAVQLGAKTAIIEEKEFGGVCLNWGCIPTKTLLKSAKVCEYIRHSEKYGIDIKDRSMVSINWDTMQKRKEKVVTQLRNGVKHLLSKNGVTIYEGRGEVIDSHTLKVNGEMLHTKNLILATGSSPKVPSIEGLKEAMEEGTVVTSKGILALKEVPKELVIIGGGVIGVEFATLFNALGSKVTILQRSQILRGVDSDIRSSMEKILRDKGIDIVYGIALEKIHQNQVIVEIKGERKVFSGDKILVSLGRKPNIEGLTHLGLDMSEKGIATNDRLETNIKGIYAIGDVNGKYLLAHLASAEGIVAVENIIGKDAKIDYNKVPLCIYSFPEVGTVGYLEEEAREKGYDPIVSTFPFSANGKALAEGDPNGFVKIIADKQYGEILGIHILAINATDMIAEAVTTMELEGTIYDLAKAIHPHPTLSEVVMEAAHGAVDKPIHLYKK